MLNLSTRTAQATMDVLQTQRSSLQGSSDSTNSITGIDCFSSSIDNNMLLYVLVGYEALISAVQSRKNRFSVVLGLIVGAQVCFVIWW
jgi:hypothetical protein